MQDKWALEEHLSAEENNDLWDSSGEAARNGEQYMEYVETHLLDVDERVKIMDATGIERSLIPRPGMFHGSHRVQCHYATQEPAPG